MRIQLERENGRNEIREAVRLEDGKDWIYLKIIQNLNGIKET